MARMRQTSVALGFPARSDMLQADQGKTTARTRRAAMNRQSATPVSGSRGIAPAAESA